MSSTSDLIVGIIEEVDIKDVTRSPLLYPSESSSGLDGLIESIKRRGLFHPITVRVKNGQFEIVAGNRRYLACKALGWRKILCHIVELEDREAFEASLIENIQRRTLNPLEEAHAFKAYVSVLGWGGVSDLAAKIGKSVSFVDRRLGLLSLPREILEKIADSSLNVTAAEDLIPIHDESRQSKLASIISRKRFSTKQARELIRNQEDSIYDSLDAKMMMPMEDINDLDKAAQRALDKSIIAIKIAQKKLTDIMEAIEDNWIIYEILMQHKHVLHTQIDVLIKEKKKI